MGIFKKKHLVQNSNEGSCPVSRGDNNNAVRKTLTTLNNCPIQNHVVIGSKQNKNHSRLNCTNVHVKGQHRFILYAYVMIALLKLVFCIWNYLMHILCMSLIFITFVATVALESSSTVTWTVASHVITLFTVYIQTVTTCQRAVRSVCVVAAN